MNNAVAAESAGAKPMNPNLERGLLLYQQSRYDLAEEQLRQALAADPDDSYSHALLALCLTEREQFKAATEEAQHAVHLAPDDPFSHYALARVFYDRDRLEEASAAIAESIRQDPTDADYHSLLAAIRFDQRRWREALRAAEQGLQSDPEHVGCTNLRAMALVKLGRRQEAGATIDVALARNPENAITHANQGWTLLEKRDHTKALEHFREALRLDPENEWARRGIVEALKAKYFIYSLMLRYFLWMSKLSHGAQWAIILGGYFGYRFLSSVSSSHPDWAPWILPLKILYIVFAIMTWIADPLFNLLLRLNRFGRLALSEEQTAASNWIGAGLLAAVLSLSWWLVAGGQQALLLALVFGLTVLPLAGTFKCQAGWPRTVMAAYTTLLGMVGTVAVLMPDGSKSLRSMGAAMMGLFLIGVFLSGWIANLLIVQRPKR